MVPPLPVRDVERVVDAVRARQERCLAVQVTGQPELLEPADVAHLPDRRLEEVGALAEHPGVAETRQQLELHGTRVQQRAEETVRRRAQSIGAHMTRTDTRPQAT